MLLRRLEAYGFKSFAEKTELDFGKGITAIVGPNGSGKSNISDAIRWVLGEQSIRSLRGSKSEDVIFAGSVKRRPMGAAEVSLIFDNSDGLLAIDFNEVIITRRIFRSGDSEYYINKSPCRLKDIHELLADTGLGRDSMSIIGQNKVDEVLNSKPEDRRSLFEEAAGITKFKHRKREALRKMEETAINLNRVNDLLSEIESQLEPMKESADKTRKFRCYQQELTAYQATLILHKLDKAEKMVHSCELEKDSLTDSEIAASSQIAITEAAKERLTYEQSEIETELAALDAAIGNNNTESERLEGQKAVLAERIRQAQRSAERLAQEARQSARQEQEVTAKLLLDQSCAREKEMEQQELTKELQALETLFAHASAETQRLVREIDMNKEKSFHHLEQLAGTRNELRLAEHELDRINEYRVTKEKEYQQTLEQYQLSTNERLRLIGEQKLLQNKHDQINEADRLIKQQGATTAARLAKAAQQQRQLASQVQECKSRLMILTHMQQDYDGFNKGIKQLLKANSQHQWRSNICGAVAELLTVPDQYVVAVETALGGSLQHIVTVDEDTAKAAIQYLQSGHMGRATFLPLTTIKPVAPGEREILATKARGIVGFASQLIEYQSVYRSIVNYLLGRVIVAENIDAAIAVAKQYSFTLRLVTLDGQQVNPGGSLTGGSNQRRENSFFSRAIEIDQLKSQFAHLSADWSAAKEQETLLQQDENDNSKQSEKLGSAKRDLDIRQAELTVELDQADSACQRLQEALRILEQDIAQRKDEYSSLQTNRENLLQTVINVEYDGSQYREQASSWQQQLTVAQHKKDDHASAITARKVSLAGLEQNIAALLGQVAETQVRIRQFQLHQEALRSELEHITAEMTVSTVEMDKLTQQKNELISCSLTLQNQRQSIYQQKLDGLASLQKLERDLREARRRYGDLQNRLHEMQMLAAKYQFEISQCTEQLEQMHISREKAQELFKTGNIEELTRQSKYWEDEIAKLGVINPGAVEEYEKLAERHRFLWQHSDDLTTAQNSLAAIIRDMDSTMAKQFEAAFAIIQEKFGQIFARMFGGGHAELELLNPENVLETGVEILVQPPGKKRQSLALLSGGERALTVIALLFSFLAFRPAPFCVVDEIDAALDEANVQRFSDFLRDYACHTQFIVVTHRKGTMEAANVLQGVTMEESGISRLLSVKLIDKAV